MNRVRLSMAHRWSLYLASAALWLTGAVWLWFSWKEPTETAGPVLLMKIHGAAAMAFLIVFGSLVQHVSAGWKTRKNRLSGSILVGTVALLVATGWGLYYIGDDRVRNAVSLAHWTIGLALAALLAGHIVLGRRPRHKR